MYPHTSLIHFNPHTHVHLAAPHAGWLDSSLFPSCCTVMSTQHPPTLARLHRPLEPTPLATAWVDWPHVEPLTITPCRLLRCLQGLNWNVQCFIDKFTPRISSQAL